MNYKKLIDGMLDELQRFADPKRLENAKRLITTSLQLIGVNAPDQKKILKGVKHELALLSEREKIQLAMEMSSMRIFELQLMAFQIIGKNKKVLKEININDLEMLAINMDNWASVDTLGVYVIGYAWEMGVVQDAFIQQLLDSPDVWRRRLAVVATVALNQRSYGALGDTAKTLHICKQVVDDRHDMIVKALSWALRKLSTCDKVAVELFIREFEPRLANRVLREVNHKLEKGTKN